MHSSIVLLSAFLAAALASPQTSGSLPLGSVCTSSAECPAGVDCYAVNSMEITRCGNEGSSCTSDLQCAFNKCVSGSCSGVLFSSSAITSSPTATASSASSAATAVPLGAACTASSQCPAGVSCYAVNSMLIPRCGNEGADCSSDAQCAFNACVSGSCSGPLLSSTSSQAGSTVTTSVRSSTAVVPTTSSGSSHSNTTITTTGVPAGFTTSTTVINGVTSGVVNASGATTSSGSVAPSVTPSVPSNGASSLAFGFGGIMALAGGAALLL